MQLHVKGRHVEVTDSLRTYAEKRLRKLERYLNDSARVEVELIAERNPSIAAHHVAEATVWTKGPVIRARESSKDVKAAIDQLVDKLDRQVGRAAKLRRDRARRSAAGVAAARRAGSASAAGREEEAEPLE